MTGRTVTLRARLLVTTLVLVLLPTLLTGSAVLVFGVRQQRERVTERNEALARGLAGEVHRFLQAQWALTEDVALVAARSRSRGPEAVREALAIHLRANPVVQQVLLLERDGRVVQAMPVDGGAVGRDLSGEGYVRAALAGAGPGWAVAESPRTGEPAVVLAVSSEGWIAVSFLDPRSLDELLSSARLEQGWTAAIVGRDGSMVAATEPGLADQHPVLTAPFIRAGVPAPRSGAYRFQGQQLLGSRWPVEGSAWSVLVSERLEQATAPVRRLQLGILLLVGAFAALGAAASVVVARRVVEPVEALSRGIRRVEEGAYHDPLPPDASGYREVVDLARAFQAMAAAVRSREEALARSERSYRTLIDNSLVGVGRFTPDGTLVSCNEALAHFFGAAAPDQVVGSSCLELYRDPTQYGVLLAAVERYGRVTNFEIQAGGRDGVERSLLLNVTREDDLLSVLAVDISELKRAAADRQRLEHQLLHAQKMEAVGRLAGGIAHDFNNLLTAIVGFAGILKDELGDQDPRSEGVQGILQSAHRASNLTRSLLAYSREQFMEPRPVDVCEIIRTVDKLLRRIIGEDVELVLDLPRGGLPAVADPGHVEQVLVNLCTNARDAMPGGGRLCIAGDEVELDAAAAASRDLAGAGWYARVRVEDSGRGMSREVMARVFEPFYTTKSAGSGTGLGLSIVYGIMRQHGGHVELESEPDRGTAVTLLFPLHRGEVGSEVAPPLREAPRGTETLLLAEDEPLVRHAMQTALRRAGYEVVEAVDGEDAVVQFAARRDRIALCVLDVVMPRKNGREAAEAITALRPGVPILLASGYTADVLEERGHGGIGVDVIAKPFTPGELLRRIRERLDRGGQA